MVLIQTPICKLRQCDVAVRREHVFEDAKTGYGLLVSLIMM